MNELNTALQSFIQALTFDTSQLAEPEIVIRLALQVRHRFVGVDCDEYGQNSTY